MYNLPKFNFEKAAENLNKTSENQMISTVAHITRVLKTLWKRFQREGRLGHTPYVS